MRLAARLAVLAWGALALGPTPAGAAGEGQAAAPSDALLVAAQLDHLDPGRGGGSLACHWVRAPDQGPIWTVGAAGFRLGESRWGFVQLGASHRPGPKTTLQGEVQLGTGERGAAGFAYRSFKLALSRELIPRRLFLELEDRYLDVDTTRGNLLTGALTVLPDRRLMLRLAYTGTTGGSLDAEYLAARLDLELSGLRLLGGGSRGRLRPESLGLILDPRVVEAREVFGGVALPWAGRELTLALAHLTLGDGERLTLTASLRLPLARPGS